MGSPSPNSYIPVHSESDEVSQNTYPTSNEQEDTWFLGSLMRFPKAVRNNHTRLAAIHNRITHEETKFDNRYQTNRLVAAQLGEFFPLKWLSEITAVFRRIEARKLGIKTYKDRVASYLGYIELYLTFRGLALLESTLAEIKKSFRVRITKNEVRSWKWKLLRVIPGLKEEWIKIRVLAHQTAIVSTVIQVMNQELTLTNCTKEDIFQIKQEALKLARQFVGTSTGKHIKNPEVWARAICLKALRTISPDYSFVPFPHLSSKTISVIQNKRWQLDKITS